jgi:LAO/AO transport system kinase
MLRPANAGWRTPVLKVSALYRRGLDKVWQEITRFRSAMGEARLAEKRARQARAWMWNEIEEGLIAALRGQPEVARRLDELEAGVAAGALTPTAAAKAILEDFRARG